MKLEQTVANNLKKHVKEKNISISVLSKETGIEERDIKRYLKGSVIPCTYSLMQLSKVLDVPVFNLLLSDEFILKYKQALIKKCASCTSLASLLSYLVVDKINDTTIKSVKNHRLSLSDGAELMGVSMNYLQWLVDND